MIHFVKLRHVLALCGFIVLILGSIIIFSTISALQYDNNCMHSLHAPGSVAVYYSICTEGHVCELFDEPVIGNIVIASQRYEYLQVGSRHFLLATADPHTEFIVGSRARAIEVDGMIGVVGMENQEEGWVFCKRVESLLEV